jgi:hypothetical protein
VTMCAEAARPVVRAATGFHADAYWGQLRQKTRLGGLLPTKEREEYRIKKLDYSERCSFRPLPRSLAFAS